MPCCIGMLIGLLLPRVVLIFYWLLTPYVGKVFDNWLWPLLGFLFMPYTTLFYLWAMVHGGRVEGLWLVLVIIGVVLDLSSYGGGGRARRGLLSRRRG